MALDIETCTLPSGRVVRVLASVTGATCLPIRDYDWFAVDYDTYDGAPDAGHQPHGYGATREAAIADLLREMAEDEEDAVAVPIAAPLWTPPSYYPSWCFQFSGMGPEHVLWTREYRRRAPEFGENPFQEDAP